MAAYPPGWGRGPRPRGWKEGDSAALFLLPFFLLPFFHLCSLRFSPYQTSHLWRGFMGEPSGQRKCSENSLELESDPMTRKREGLCGSVMRPSWELSGVRTEHQTWGWGSNEGKLGSLWGTKAAGLAPLRPSRMSPRSQGARSRWSGEARGLDMPTGGPSLVGVSALAPPARAKALTLLCLVHPHT